MSLWGQIFRRGKMTQSDCHVFINYRRVDTNKNVAGLLYDHFSRLNLRPFLDSKSMKPGDKLFEKIHTAIRDCKVGIAVFSPNYCNSYFCLHELCMIIECKKRVVPIFVDVKPSELRVLDNRSSPAKELFRFREAIEEVKNTVGLTFDSTNGDWSDLIKNASDAVMKNLLEVEGETLGVRVYAVSADPSVAAKYLRLLWYTGKKPPENHTKENGKKPTKTSQGKIHVCVEIHECIKYEEFKMYVYVLYKGALINGDVILYKSNIFHCNEFPKIGIRAIIILEVILEASGD
ncbi:probable 2' cyclic ADP-D-ribose synthase BdTIR [Rhododendron vialii]|uniref:probable 2' cyclic ADP-D-ribose synthase BdTIR n=1 Tax=Rhododendron vialii TaxID=182163 RepID=UPI00265E02D7|nr:probable 2' cyclic ADP-D-ribose synthase BdTIR [Rhododendron vialii]